MAHTNKGIGDVVLSPGSTWITHKLAVFITMSISLSSWTILLILFSHYSFLDRVHIVKLPDYTPTEQVSGSNLLPLVYKMEGPVELGIMENGHSCRGIWLTSVQGCLQNWNLHHMFDMEEYQRYWLGLPTLVAAYRLT